MPGALRGSGTDVGALVAAALARFTAAERTHMGEAAQGNAREEVVADVIPAVSAQAETVERTARADRGLSRRIADFFRRLAAKLREMLGRLAARRVA